MRFRYRDMVSGDTDRDHYGLIAEEVAEVAPEMVRFDEAGAPFTVRYQFLAPMLLNELQKQQRAVEQGRAEIAALEERLGRLELQLRDGSVGSGR